MCDLRDTIVVQNRSFFLSLSLSLSGSLSLMIFSQGPCWAHVSDVALVCENCEQFEAHHQVILAASEPRVR